jgi:hypothetical protein
VDSGLIRYNVLIIICLIGALSTEHIYPANDNYLSGARFSAMGNVGVMCSDLWSVSHNQAGLGFYNHFAAGFHHENRFAIPEFNLNSAAFIMPTRTGTFGLSYTYFGYSSYHENKIGLAFGKSLNKWVSAGIQFNYLNTYVADETGNINSMAIEAGIIGRPIQNLSIGVHVYNPIGSSFNGLSVKEKIPVIFSLGIGYEYKDKLLLAIETTKDLEVAPVSFKAGFEYQIQHFLFIRTGVIINDLVSHSFGLGLALKKIRVDLAFSHQQIIGYTPHFSVQYWFR